MAHAATQFLTRAARQSVSWQTWGRESFTLAARLDRPILLYVGADQCRPCVAMDRETYSNLELGRMIDSLFVPVRVDRDERPDVALRYGVAVHVLTGLQGYPLTVFLNSDGSAFFGGTYFPADDPVTGRGMRQIIPEVARSFRAQRGFIVRQAALVRQLSLNRESGAHGVLEPRAVAAGIDSVRTALARSAVRSAQVGSFVYQQAATLVLAAPGGDSATLAWRRRLLDRVADSGEALVEAGEGDEPPGVVRAGMLRNLTLGWSLTREPRYGEAARRMLASQVETLEQHDGDAVFADRAGYVIGSLVDAAATIGDSGAQRTGLAALDSVLTRDYVAGRGVRHQASEPNPVRLLLQDQVQVASACVAAYRVSGDAWYLRVAEDLADVLERSFADPLGGYFEASDVDREVPGWADRAKPIWDDQLPGANAWAAQLLLWLAEVTGEPGYRQRAEATLEAFAGLTPIDQMRAASYLAVARAILSPR
jgi:uncharacterized protein YyaL (SSP411 family)